MSLRSQHTRWFEVFVRRDQVVYALEALAGTDSIELELDPRFTGSLDIEALRKGINEFYRLADPYRNLLPDGADKPTRITGPPESQIGQMLEYLQHWVDQLEQLLNEASALSEQREQLRTLQEAAIAMGESADQLPQMTHSSELLFKRLYRCASCQAEDYLPADILRQSYRVDDHCFLLIACLPEERRKLTRLLSDAGCETVSIPSGLPSEPARQLAEIRRRLRRIDADIGNVQRRIEALRIDPKMSEAVANTETLRWFIGSAHQVGVKGAEFCHITGWTSEPDLERLKKVLQQAHVEAEARFASPPIGAREPVATSFNWWRQPFQIFTTMSGALSPDEIDPTGLLAVVVPLLFGYMFPDTGHGLVIALGGIILSRYVSRARLLISCGLASALMGFVFDDFFGYRMLNESWQIHALESPVLVLVIPMLFGIGLLLLGLVFNGIELYWRGELHRWFLSDAAALLLYVSLLVSLLYGQALVLASIALLWYVAGAIAMGGRARVSRAATAFVELAHSTLTLLLNTISFVRVGAFALAHVGLTHVVVTLTTAVETPVLSVLLFILGHTIIIVLEGVVVFVQITRLVLFEFFIRFLRSEGRFLKPLSSPGPPPRDG